MSDRPFKRIIYKCPICNKVFTSSRDPDPIERPELVAMELAGKTTANCCSAECNLKHIEQIVRRDNMQFVGRELDEEGIEVIRNNTVKILKDQFLYLREEFLKPSD